MTSPVSCEHSACVSRIIHRAHARRGSRSNTRNHRRSCHAELASVGCNHAGRCHRGRRRGRTRRGGAGSNTLTGQDIAEIERLYYRYSQGLDFQDEELYLSAWADDAVFTTGAGEVWERRDGLRARFRQRPGPEGTTITHNNTNILVKGTAERRQGAGLLDRGRHLPISARDLGAWTLFRHVRAHPLRLADKDARVDAGME